MQQTLKKTSKFKLRIFYRISIVFAISVFFSSIIGYVYFNNVVRYQKIQDEITNQIEISNQLTFMTEDIDNFAKSVVVDETLQDELKVYNYDNEFEKLKKYQKISKRLAFYNGLRPYIANSFFELKNGDRFSSNGDINNIQGISDKFETPEIAEFIENPNWIYSNKYIAEEDVRVNNELLCYRTNILSTDDFGEIEGTLYLEIYLDYLIDPIKLYSENYENVVLFGNGEEVLFSKDKNDIITNGMKNIDITKEKTINKIDDGYMLIKPIEKTNWHLCTLISNQYLWSRSSFVLKIFFIMFIISLILILFSVSKVLDKLIEPITELSDSINESSYDNIEFSKIIKTGDEIETLYKCYKNLVDEIKKGIEDKKERDMIEKELEFDIIMSQINPHYLYNVLNTIVYLSASNKNRDVMKVTNALMYTLQTTINLSEHNIETSIENELKLIKSYTEIQGYRYPNRFTIEIFCKEKLKNYKILKTSVQPIVENAIIHGIIVSDKIGKITINIELIDEFIKISVIDNGIGINIDVVNQFYKGEKIEKKQADRNHIGISSIRDRISYLYGEPYKMLIGKTDYDETEVILYLPVIKNI